MTMSSEATQGQPALIAAALLLLEQGNREAAAQILQRARAEPATLLQAHGLIEAYGLDGSFGNMMGLDCSISPNDDIFGFFAGHHTSINPLRDYLADGWRTQAELMALMESVGQPLMQTTQFLEFASGHGRCQTRAGAHAEPGRPQHR